MSFNYYLITNVGTILNSTVCQRYPYQMVLAQQYLSSEDYKSTLAKMLELDSSMVMILDNGAHEGIEIDPETYKQVIDDLRPTMVVLPDLIGRPGKESRRLSMDFARWMEDMYGEDIQMMFAGQGASQEDILDQYHWAINTLDPKRFIIGFGQSYLTWVDDRLGPQWEQARREMIMEIANREGLINPRLKQCRFHILGGRWNPVDYTDIRKYMNLTGIDSVKPFTCTASCLYYPIYIKERAKTDLCSWEPIVESSALTRNIDRFVSTYGLDKIDWSPYFRTSSVW